MTRPHTIFIDIDGTILEHRADSNEIYNLAPQKPTPDAVNKFNEWAEAGHTVIIISARQENVTMRTYTVKQLEKWGFKYHRLILGITSGVRYMINDEKPNNKMTAIGITIPRDKGLGDLNI
jgi:histidinol phosphatase-like enzyme